MVLKTISSLTVALLLSGCNTSTVSLKTELKKPQIVKKELDYFKITKGSSLKDFFDVLRKKDYNIISFVNDTDEIIFYDNLNNVTIKNILNYLSKIHERKFKLEFESKTIAYFKEEIKQQQSKKEKEKIKELKDIELYPQLDKIQGINKEFNIKGKFKYSDVFYILQRSKYNIHFQEFDTDKVNMETEIKDYYGTIKSFLTDFALKENFFIEVSKNTIHFRDKVTKSYDLNLQPLQISTSEGFKNMVSDAIKPFEDLETQLKSLVDNHGTFNINKSNGMLSIFGDAYAIKTTDKVVNKFKDIYGKSIRLELHVYEVDLDNDKSLGLDLTNFIGQLGKANFKFNSALTSNLASVGSSQLILNNVETQDGVNETLFKFLNKYGNTKVVTKPILETINNLPVTMNFTNNVDYVKSINETTYSSAYGNNSNGETLNGSNQNNNQNNNQSYNNQNNNFSQSAKSTYSKEVTPLESNGNTGNNNQNNDNFFGYSNPNQGTNQNSSQGNYNAQVTSNNNFIQSNVNVETAIAKSGFMLSLFPRIEENGKIKVVLKPIIKKLQKLTPLEYGSSNEKRIIQLKNESEKEISQIITVEDGAMAIISGYIYEKEVLSKQSLPGISKEDSIYDMLGSSKGNKKQRTELIFTLKANIVD
jgi:hypothetical protein